jgi:hypothetical protein
MAWSEAARQASAEARKASAKAKAEPTEANHRAAAEAHSKAADANRAAGQDAKADHHEAISDKHGEKAGKIFNESVDSRPGQAPSVRNAQENRSQSNRDTKASGAPTESKASEGRTADVATKASGAVMSSVQQHDKAKILTKEANTASAEAKSKGGINRHLEAESAHRIAASAHRLTGNETAHDHHIAMADKHHEKAAPKIKKMKLQ